MKNNKDIIKLFKKGKTPVEIIKLTGYSDTTVYDILIKSGLKEPRKNKVKEMIKIIESNKDLIISKYNSGIGYVEIAKNLKCTSLRIRKFLEKNIINFNPQDTSRRRNYKGRAINYGSGQCYKCSDCNSRRIEPTEIGPEETWLWNLIDGKSTEKFEFGEK